ncbi:hypothetical protein Dred_1187 [Desulforamulus reducens MI-1]|uniref:rRNA biogenesis protein rrp5 n=1 Tax=Desulforamulus reducens (strain ATCC BAA-1160 / DSM 100696 / MI-1) TaxID=349161 RepID=A4J3R8_DESRM|nr:hypothetical protein [Desulforamulus reducens]ABO49721.1 hypothetical protein Dred_1187 [Desulforamulus reducens MI-1]
MEININLNINAPEICSTIREVAPLLLAARTTNVVNAATSAAENSKSNFSFKLPADQKENTTPDKAEVKAAPEKEKPAKANDKAKQQKEQKQEPEPAPEPEPEKTTEEPASENVNDTQPEYTMEQVRAKLMALAQDGKQAQVKKIITDCGAKKLTDIPADKYAEVMAAAEAL